MTGSILKLSKHTCTGPRRVVSLGFLLWVPSGCHLSSPLLPFQIIKAYLDYSLHHQLAGYQDVWYKYEIMAMEQIFNLPLKGEGIEIVSHVADKLGYTKLLMGHLDLAIDLGKGCLGEKGHADTKSHPEISWNCFLPRLSSPEDVGTAPKS